MITSTSSSVSVVSRPTLPSADTAPPVTGLATTGQALIGAQTSSLTGAGGLSPELLNALLAQQRDRMLLGQAEKNTLLQQPMWGKPASDRQTPYGTTRSILASFGMTEPLKTQNISQLTGEIRQQFPHMPRALISAESVLGVLLSAPGTFATERENITNVSSPFSPWQATLLTQPPIIPLPASEPQTMLSTRLRRKLCYALEVIAVATVLYLVVEILF